MIKSQSQKHKKRKKKFFNRRRMRNRPTFKMANKIF